MQGLGTIDDKLMAESVDLIAGNTGADGKVAPKYVCDTSALPQPGRSRSSRPPQKELLAASAVPSPRKGKAAPQRARHGESLRVWPRTNGINTVVKHATAAAYKSGRRPKAENVKQIIASLALMLAGLPASHAAPVSIRCADEFDKRCYT